MLLGTKQLISLKYYGKWEGCTKDDFLCVFWFARQALKHRWSDKDSKLLLSVLSLTSWQVTWTAAHPLKSIKHYRIQNVLEQVQYMSNQTVLFYCPPYFPFRSQDFWNGGSPDSQYSKYSWGDINRMKCRHNTDKNTICCLTDRTVYSLKTGENGGEGASVPVRACQVNLNSKSSIHNWEITWSF